MNEDAYYLLDNNVVSHLSRRDLGSALFTERCRVPSEVLHEARGNRHRGLLDAVEYRTDAAVLGALVDVLRTVSPSDTKLLDLYANKGNADPILVACGLVESRKSALMLVQPLWYVVSNDSHVRTRAEALGLRSMTRESFLTLVRGQQKESDDDLRP